MNGFRPVGKFVALKAEFGGQKTTEAGIIYTVMVSPKTSRLATRLFGISPKSEEITSRSSTSFIRNTSTWWSASKWHSDIHTT